MDDSAIDTPPSEPTKPSPRKRPLEEEEKRHPKKIILNRKTVEAPDPEPVTELLPPVISEEEPKAEVKAADADKPKLHVLTDAEVGRRRLRTLVILAAKRTCLGTYPTDMALQTYREYDFRGKKEEWHVSVLLQQKQNRPQR